MSRKDSRSAVREAMLDVRRSSISAQVSGLVLFSERYVERQISLQGNWEEARIASSSSRLASVCIIPSISAVLLAMQTELMAIFASMTSAQDTRAPFTDDKRTPARRNSRLYARSLERKYSLAGCNQRVERDEKVTTHLFL